MGFLSYGGKRTQHIQSTMSGVSKLRSPRHFVCGQKLGNCTRNLQRSAAYMDFMFLPQVEARCSGF